MNEPLGNCNLDYINNSVSEDLLQFGVKTVPITQEVIDGICFMFDIIDLEVGDRMDYLEQEDKAKVAAVSEWLAKIQGRSILAED